MLIKTKELYVSYVNYRKSINHGLEPNLPFRCRLCERHKQVGKDFMRRVLWLGGTISAVAILMAILVVGPTPVNAQGFATGSISGTITDPSGQVVAGTKVTADGSEPFHQPTVHRGDHGVRLIQPASGSSRLLQGQD
jgi:hypothetical protein